MPITILSQHEIFAATRQSTGALYISPVQSIRLTQTESQRPDGGLIRQPLQVRKGVNRNPSRRPGLAVSDSNLHAVKTGHSDMPPDLRAAPHTGPDYVGGRLTAELRSTRQAAAPAANEPNLRRSGRLDSENSSDHFFRRDGPHAARQTRPRASCPAQGGGVHHAAAAAAATG